MEPHTNLRSLARALFLGFFVLSSAYCLLAYIPFTYFALIHAPFQAWMPAFAHYYPLLFAAVAALAAWTWWPGVAAMGKGRTPRRLTVGMFVFRAGSAYLAGCAFLAGCAAWFFWRSPLEALKNEPYSYVWAVAMLFPLYWAAAMDQTAAHVAGRASGSAISAGDNVDSGDNLDHGRADAARAPLLGAAIAASLVIASFYSAMSLLRTWITARSLPLTPMEWLAVPWSAAMHALVFIFAAGLLALGASLPAPSRQRRALWLALAGALLGIAVLRRVVLAALAFETPAADVYAVAFAVGVALFLSGAWLRRPRAPGWNASSPADASHNGAKARRGKKEIVVVTVLLAAMIYSVPPLIGGMDWNMLLEKLWTLALWCAAFAVALGWWPRQWALRALAATATWKAALVTTIAAFAGYKLLNVLLSFALMHTAGVNVDAERSLERYATVDTSFRLVRELMAPSLADPCNDFCHYLAANSNLPASMQVRPVEIELARRTNTPAQAGPKPNIIIIVIDSLRQDYVSAYNPKVDFTPNLGRFAQESVVLRKAFTRYGGTTLSEPAIWAGAMLPHKHYVQPFAPMNSLERLIREEGYLRMISVDTVLGMLLQSETADVHLDAAATDWTKVDFCSTATEIAERMERMAQTRAQHISQDKAKRQPVFVFSQPTNIHLVMLSKLGNRRPPRREYPGFHAQYASELERLDGCFGGFVQRLKALGEYDNSIIVVTSDHGDSLGEMNRYGHDFSLYPEVLRVPLMVHLPQAMRELYQADTELPAFVTDIAPSLYYLLGRRPTLNDEVVGRPLFTETAAEQAVYARTSYLVASSYGPVYGLLNADASDLFIFDAVHHEEHFFRIDVDPYARRELLTDEVLKRNEAVMREHIKALNRFYRFDPEVEARKNINWALQ